MSDVKRILEQARESVVSATSSSDDIAFRRRRRQAPSRIAAAVVALGLTGLVATGLWVTRWDRGTAGRGESVGAASQPSTLVQTTLSGLPVDVWAGADAVWVIVADKGDSPGALLRIDPLTGEVLAEVQVGSNPTAVVGTATDIWVSSADGTVTRVDSLTNTVDATIQMPDLPSPVSEGDARFIPIDLTVSGDSIWVVTARAAIARVDSVTNDVIATINVDGLPQNVVAAGDSVWVSNVEAGTIMRIDAQRNTVASSVEVGPSPSYLDGDDQYVYVETDGARSTGTLVLVDASSERVAGTIVVGDTPGPVACLKGSCWIGDASGNLVRVDITSGNVESSTTVRGGVDGISAEGTGVWAISTEGSLVQLEASPLE